MTGDARYAWKIDMPKAYVCPHSTNENTAICNCNGLGYMTDGGKLYLVLEMKDSIVSNYRILYVMKKR